MFVQFILSHYKSQYVVPDVTINVMMVSLFVSEEEVPDAKSDHQTEQ